MAKSLAAIALLGVAGIVGAESCYHHEAGGDSATQAEQNAPAGQAIGSQDPWAEMQRIQARMDRMFEEAIQNFPSDRFFQPLEQDQQLVAQPKSLSRTSRINTSSRPIFPAPRQRISTSV